MELNLGQVVISKQGKDSGLIYVVSGFSPDGKINLIRPNKFNLSRPKRKNIKHLQFTKIIINELAELIKAGNHDIDRGYFFRSLDLWQIRKNLAKKK